MNFILPLTGLRKWFGGVRPCASFEPVERLGKRSATGRTLAKGEGVACIRGAIWITDRGGRDVILREGGRYQPARRGRIVIEALEDSILRPFKE